MKTGTAIGYRGHVHASDNGYRHYELELFGGSVCDLAKTYKQSGDKYDLERLQAVREATGDTLYFCDCRDDRVVLRWQSDLSTVFPETKICGWNHWYALKIESGEFCDWTIKTLSRIRKEFAKDNEYRSIGNATPLEIVDCLQRMRGVAVKYSDIGCSTWLMQEWGDSRWHEASHAVYSRLPMKYHTRNLVTA